LVAVEMEKNPHFLLPDGAKDFFVREFGEEAPMWGERLAYLFHRSIVISPSTPAYRQARQELDTIEPVLRAAKKAAGALRKWPHDAIKIFHFSNSYEEISQALSVAIEVLEAAETERKHVSGAYAPRGNRDRGAINYAHFVAQSFAYIGEPVTFGQDQFGEPTTRYGRVVKFGLAFNSFDSHWRRPAEVGFKEFTLNNSHPIDFAL